MAQAKKTVKKTVKKAAANKPAPKVVAVAAPAAECSCKRVCWKKILIFVLGVVVGAAACCLVCSKGGHKRFFKRGMEVGHISFTNGCLDLAKIDCPDKAAKIQAKDADKNGCITKEELFGEKPMPQGPRGRKPRAPRPAAN